MSEPSTRYIIHVGLDTDVEGEVEEVASSIEFELESRGDVDDWDVWYEAVENGGQQS